MQVLLPQYFLNSIKKLNFIDYDKFLNSFDETPPTSIRINPKKMKQLNLKTVPWSKYGFYLENRPEFILDPAWHSGAYYVQESASMFIEHILKELNLNNKDVIALDLSAAPGGKSTHILSLISENSILISNEILLKRAKILEENLIRWGYDNFILTNNKSSDFKNFTSTFDIVFVDAPCSGEGMFRKDPNSINEWSEENVKICKERQIEILDNIEHTLKENAFLVYSTCTYNIHENEEVINQFIKKYNYEIIEINISNFKNIVSNQNTLRFIPGNVDSEGFTITVLQKKTKCENINQKYPKLIESNNPFPDLIKEKKDYLKYYIFNNKMYLFNSNYQYLLEKLVYELNVITFGNKIANLIKKNKLIFSPEHNLASAINIEKNKIYFLEEADVLKYLKGEVLRINLNEKGIYFVNYKDLSIGLINNLQNRANNLYPDNFRIKKQVSFYEPIKSIFQSKENRNS